MKLFTSIFALYVLVLTVMPCPDLCSYNPKTLTESIKTSPNSTDNGIDQCSPFCTCSCCASTVLDQNTSFSFSCFIFSGEKFSDFNPDFVSSFYTSIWQPPKLS
jgi:hypothetical protein